MIDRELICISCPSGCHIRVQGKDYDNLTVSGNRCKYGEIYGIEEVRDPRRVLPTTVAIDNAVFSRLPVKTNAAIPKPLLMPAMDVIRQIRVKAPIKIGDVIVPNLLDTGIDVVATRDMPIAAEN